MKLKFAKAKGFTLMEVLVVVLILAILATIALPTYYKAVLKSRAAEAINLLMMVRSKQAVNFSRDQRFFTGFDQIPGGKLTLGQEAYSQNSPNLLVIGDGHYEVELQPENQCAVSRYIENGEQKFEFSISYLRNGLGCTGEICDGFPDVIALSGDFCTAPIPPIPPAGCPDPNFNPNSCIYPKILSADGCGCQCPAGIEQSCSSFQTFNDQTCKCECDQTKVPTPANQENYDFSPETCWTCKLTAETCAAQNKLFDHDSCECVCRMVDGSCCCPQEDQVNIGGVCTYCNGNHYVSNGVGYCCDDPEKPFFNNFSKMCEPCPVGSHWDASLKQCICTAVSKILSGTSCVCNTELGWQTASYGSELVSGCCNVNTSNYITGNPSACCPAGVNSFTYSWRQYAGGPITTKRMCCTTDRPYVNSTPTTNFTNTTPNANDYCRKCPNATDTWNEATGQCEPCPSGTYANTSTIPSLGYATCSGCQEPLVLNSNSTGCVCDTANGWQAASYGSELVSGCCNVNTSNYITGNPSACCPTGVNSFTYSWRQYAGGPITTKRMCCTTDRPYVNSTPTTYFTGNTLPNPSDYCRKCPNATDTWNEATGQCEPCPSGVYANTSTISSLGYATCSGCQSNQVVTSTGCACDTENGWQAASYGSELVNGCCNVNTSNYITGNPSACCPAGVNSFTYSWRQYAGGPITTKRMCCTTDRPYVNSTPTTNFTGNTLPNPSDYCRKCPNATDTWNEATGQCEPCPNGVYANTSTISSLGYASCSGCQSNQIVTSTGCACDTEHGWQPVSYGSAAVNGCCNVNTSNYITANPSACCPAGVNSFTYSWRQYAGGPITTKRMCCTTDRPYVNSTPTTNFTNTTPNANDYCRKCPNATDTWNEATGQCEPCPNGVYANTATIPSLGYATCSGCQSNQVVTSTGCVCDTAHGWQAASYGSELVNGCCNVNTSNYITANPSACCPAGVNSFTYSWRQYAGGPITTKRMCCTTARPYVNSTPTTNFTNTTPNANDYCRKCPNATDTMLNGHCMSCDEAYPGQNRVAVYNAYADDGFASCVCPSNTVETSSGVCLNCAQMYGPGYTYTNKSGMQGTPHCCHPDYSVDNTTENGCSQCPIGAHFSNNCQGCICDSSTGHTGFYGQTNKCTRDQCDGLRIFALNTCQCVCPVIDGVNTHLTWDVDLGCCHCEAKEIPFGQEGYDPRFNPNGNGCYIGETI